MRARRLPAAAKLKPVHCTTLRAAACYRRTRCGSPGTEGGPPRRARGLPALGGVPSSAALLHAANDVTRPPRPNTLLLSRRRQALAAPRCSRELNPRQGRPVPWFGRFVYVGNCLRKMILAGQGRGTGHRARRRRRRRAEGLGRSSCPECHFPRNLRACVFYRCKQGNCLISGFKVTSVARSSHSASAGATGARARRNARSSPGQHGQQPRPNRRAPPAQAGGRAAPARRHRPPAAARIKRGRRANGAPPPLVRAARGCGRQQSVSRALAQLETSRAWRCQRRCRPGSCTF